MPAWPILLVLQAEQRARGLDAMRAGGRAARVTTLALAAAACAHGDGVVRSEARSTAPRVAAAPAADRAPAPAQVTFAQDVQPILARRCQPCHFSGGVMYGKLPFDREATVHELGERLFTRIKQADEQKAIRALLAPPVRRP